MADPKTIKVDPTPQARRSLSAIATRAETALRKASRRVLLGVTAAAVLAVILSGAALVVSVSIARSETAVQAAERVAARTQDGRDQLASANTARALRGLPPFPDPGPGAGPDLLWLSAARAWQGVDDIDTQAGGAAQPGVSTPAPTGPFPTGR